MKTDTNDWAYFSTTTEPGPVGYDYTVGRIEASVVLRVDPEGNAYYALDVPEWKVRQVVNKMFNDWIYLRKIEKEREDGTHQ